MGFELGAYDHSLALVIDPVLAYSTYLGGSSSDLGEAVAVDAAGNAYVTGQSTSANFPVTPGAVANGGEQIFVSKFGPTGSLVYSARFSNGLGMAIAVDGGGDAYVTGNTFDSTGFPVTPGAPQQTYGGGTADAFVAKLSPAGDSLLYASYLGGSGTDDPTTSSPPETLGSRSIRPAMPT